MERIQEKETKYREALNKAELFDCNVWWDPLTDNNLKNYADFEELLSACETEGIQRGIVTDVQAATLDNHTGNERLRSLLKGHKGWYGALVLTPDICFDGNETVFGWPECFQRTSSIPWKNMP